MFGAVLHLTSRKIVESQEIDQPCFGETLTIIEFTSRILLHYSIRFIVLKAEGRSRGPVNAEDSGVGQAGGALDDFAQMRLLKLSSGMNEPTRTAESPVWTGHSTRSVDSKCNAAW
ncbi:MAG: hypothetical protein ABSF60_08745 [Verrucomicrobiota bacterium]